MGCHCLLRIIGDWDAKVGTEEIPGVTGKFGLGVQNEAGQIANRVLLRECTHHSKHPLPTTQEKTVHMDITSLNITDESGRSYLAPDLREKALFFFFSPLSITLAMQFS